jgi:hypothetical protein
MLRSSQWPLSFRFLHFKHSRHLLSSKHAICPTHPIRREPRHSAQKQDTVWPTFNYTPSYAQNISETQIQTEIKRAKIRVFGYRGNSKIHQPQWRKVLHCATCDARAVHTSGINLSQATRKCKSSLRHSWRQWTALKYSKRYFSYNTVKFVTWGALAPQVTIIHT